MTHQRKTNGLRQSAQLRHQQAVQRVEDGFCRLLQEEKPINFNIVAETAKVSTAWLYRTPEIRQHIEHLRQQPCIHSVLPAREKASDASKNAVLVALRNRVKALEAEIRNSSANSKLFMSSSS
jgi:Family of unknown function (DUF6262)